MTFTKQFGFNYYLNTFLLIIDWDKNNS